MKLSFKIIWILSLALSFVAGYFANNKAIEDTTISLLDTKEQCMRVGSEVHNKITTEYNESDLDATVLRPEYAYNSRLDTCLYSSGAVSGTENGYLMVQKWVVDSFTNEQLLSFTSFDGEASGLTLDEFGLQKDNLFTEK